MAEKMAALAAQQPGYLGWRAARGADGLGLTISYWRDEASIVAWKRDTEHQQAQRGGQQTWYADYEVRIAKVERAYGSRTIDRGIYCHCESSALAGRRSNPAISTSSRSRAGRGTGSPRCAARTREDRKEGRRLTISLTD